MTELKWQDPPTKAGCGHWRKKIVEQLKERPGQWALVESGVGPQRGSSWRRLGCEARTSSVGEGKSITCADVYARWPEVSA